MKKSFASNNKNRIVIIGACGSSLINFRLQLIKELIKNGYEVHAIASYTEDAAKILESIDVMFYPINVNRHSNSPRKDITYFLQLYQKIRKINPEICLTYTIKPVIYGTLAAACADVKMRFSLITGLGYVFTAKTTKALLAKIIVCILYKIAFAISKKVIFQNEDDRNDLCRLKLINPKKTAIVNGSGVDLQYFQPAPFPKQLTFLMISRFLPEKGIFEYVEACKRIKAEHSNIRCCLVGYIDNPLAGITENTIKTWQSYGIEYLGKLNDVRPAIRESSVYVLPSYREGTPRSVLEAMAMGRPVITTDAPGCRQTVEDGGNGFRIPIRDSEALYQAMLRFINQYFLINKMSEKSIEAVIKNFDINFVNKKMLEIMNIYPLP